MPFNIRTNPVETSVGGGPPCRPISRSGRLARNANDADTEQEVSQHHHGAAGQALMRSGSALPRAGWVSGFRSNADVPASLCTPCATGVHLANRPRVPHLSVELAALARAPGAQMRRHATGAPKETKCVLRPLPCLLAAGCLNSRLHRIRACTRVYAERFEGSE
jgi:hypothetical protein